MMLAHLQTVTDKKREFREAAIARRDLLPPDDRVRAARGVVELPFPVAVSKGAIVAGFSPIRTEFNPIPLMRELVKVGAQIALPKITGRGKPLSMRAWNFGEPLIAGVWGIREPGPDAPEVAPDILLVPFAAFDRAGYRIGYGAGYYDMTLAALRAKKKIVAIGLGFTVQEVDHVPVEAHDQRLDFVLTEAGLKFGGAKL